MNDVWRVWNDMALPSQTLIIYLLCINTIAFISYGIDKYKSLHASRRIREKTLWFLALIGGSLGSLLAMKFFRHKTRKTSFQAILIIIIALQVALIFSLINYFQK